jgi:hypothetical protein
MLPFIIVKQWRKCNGFAKSKGKWLTTAAANAMMVPVQSLRFGKKDRKGQCSAACLLCCGGLTFGAERREASAVLAPAKGYARIGLGT